MRQFIPVLAAALALAACSTGTRYEFQPPAADEPEGRISFIQHHGIYNWEAVSDQLLYVQSADRQWYKVDLFGPCIGLEYANRVRFLPSDSAGSFDRFSSIDINSTDVGRQRCKVSSVKKIPPPVKVQVAPHTQPAKPNET